ncbi:GumC family protein [Roseibium sp.]|uniref:GumC family protein n=1 Tax=Roseibium sp. TaxID=1936156 RepID=UPI003BA8FE04
MEQSFDLRTVTSMAKRRYLYFVLPAVVIFAAAVFVAYSLPRVYEAKAVILIESQRIPNQLASATVNADPSERLKVIEQRLLARDNLLSIANEYSLYRGGGETPSPTIIVEKMRSAITIQQISVARSRKNTQIVGFEVSYEYESPTTAARVTNELVNSILSQNLETRLSRAAETSEFFYQQLRDLENELLEMEAKMAAFKRENEATLPETLNERRASRAQVVTQLNLIEQQLRAMKEIDGAAISPDDNGAQQLTFRLQSAELSHEALLERREQLAPLFEKGFVSKNTMDGLDRQIAQSEIQMASIKSQMAQEGITINPETRLKLLTAQKEELQNQADELAQSIAQTPGIEVQLQAMAREYENLRGEFNQTKVKLTDAEIGEKLEQDRQAERFEILEQATTPDEPASPNRIQIVAAGGGGAVAVGVALVLLLEFLDNSIRTAGDLEKRLQVRPIAVIPYVTTRRERARRFFRRMLTVCLALLAIFGAIAVVHLYVTPVDLLAERLWLKVQPYLLKLNLI